MQPWSRCMLRRLFMWRSMPSRGVEGWHVHVVVVVVLVVVVWGGGWG